MQRNDINNLGQQNFDLQQQYQQQQYQQQQYQQQYPNGYVNPQKKAPKIIITLIVICLLICCCGFGGILLGTSGNKKTGVDSSLSNSESKSNDKSKSSNNAQNNNSKIEDSGLQIEESKPVEQEKKTYHIGDDILVETDAGSYSLCITGVSETSDRNQFSDQQADRVVIIDYNFKNISHSTDFGDYHNDELHIGDFDFSMYDADGEILETYPANIKYAQAVSVGHKSSGQMAYALNNNQNYIEAEYHDNIFMGSNFTIILEW